MPRPKIPRHLCFQPNVYYFKPQGIPLTDLQEVIILSDELEALKLYEVDNFSQTESSKKMKISQPTFARLLDKVQRKIADALINGKAIRVEK